MNFADTPDDNLPLILPKDLVGPVFALLERIDMNMTDLFLTDSMNFHLGTNGLNLTEISIEANQRGIDFIDVIVMTE